MDFTTKSDDVENKSKRKEEKMKSVTYNVVVRERNDYHDYKKIKMHFQLQQAEKRLKVGMDLTRVVKKEPALLSPGLGMAVPSKQPRNSKLGKVKKRKPIFGDNIQDSGEKLAKTKHLRKHKTRSPRLSKQLIFSPSSKNTVEQTNSFQPKETIKEINDADISNIYQPTIDTANLTSDNRHSDMKISPPFNAKTAVFDKDSYKYETVKLSGVNTKTEKKSSSIPRYEQSLKMETKEDTAEKPYKLPSGILPIKKPKLSNKELESSEYKLVPEDLISITGTNEEESQKRLTPSELISHEHKTVTASERESLQLPTEEKSNITLTEQINEVTKTTLEQNDDKLSTQLSPQMQDLPTDTVPDVIQLIPEINKPEYKMQAIYSAESIIEPEDSFTSPKNLLELKSDTKEISNGDQDDNLVSDQILFEEISPVKSEKQISDVLSSDNLNDTEGVSQTAINDLSEAFAPDTSSVINKPVSETNLTTDSMEIPTEITIKQDTKYENLENIDTSGEDTNFTIHVPEDSIDNNILEPQIPDQLFSESLSPNKMRGSIDEIIKQIVMSPDITEEVKDATQEQPEDLIIDSNLESEPDAEVLQKSPSLEEVNNKIEKSSDQIKISPERTGKFEDEQPEDSITDSILVESEPPVVVTRKSTPSEELYNEIKKSSDQIKISPDSTVKVKDAIQEHPEGSINVSTFESEPLTDVGVTPKTSPSEEIYDGANIASEQIKLSPKLAEKNTDLTKSGLDSLHHKTSESDTPVKNTPRTSPSEKKLITELNEIEENLQYIKPQDLDLSADDEISLLESFDESLDFDSNVSNEDIQQFDVIVDDKNKREEKVNIDINSDYEKNGLSILKFEAENEEVIQEPVLTERTEIDIGSDQSLTVDKSPSKDITLMYNEKYLPVPHKDIESISSISNKIENDNDDTSTLNLQIKTNNDNTDKENILGKKKHSVSSILPEEIEKSDTIHHDNLKITENINLAEQILPKPEERERFIDPSPAPPESGMIDLNATTADESSEKVQDQSREAAVEKTQDDQSVTISEKEPPDQEKTSSSDAGVVLVALITYLSYAAQFTLIAASILSYYLTACIFYQKQIIFWSLCMLKISWDIGTERLKNKPNITKLSSLHIIWFFVGLYIKLLVSMKGYIFAPLLVVYNMIF